jgi:MoxR-like ATPase
MSLQEKFLRLETHLKRLVVGQEHLLGRMLTALLCDGHLLVEGAPGLAKTRAIKVLSHSVEGDFHRLQFTPDLLPADLTGTEIYRPEDGSFVFRQGPLFHNLVLADEVNRAPAKVQSALLEAMGERQITVGSVTYPLPTLYLVMATQNPIEQEGTYPLPEAQLDRFLLHVLVDYPDAAGERAILEINRAEQKRGASDADLFKAAEPLSQKEVFAARLEVLETHLAEPLEEYLVQIVLATRAPERYGEDLVGTLQYGASPRATIALDRCSRAHAWLSGRDFVTPEDVQSVAHDVLRHRILLSFEAEAAGRTPDELTSTILERIGVP